MRSRLFSSTLAAAAVAVALGATLAAQAPQGPPPAGAQGGGGGGRGGGRGFAMVPMLLESDAYADGAVVPAKYAAAGGSTMPGFKITNVPMGTVSFAVVFHDMEPNIGNPPADVLHAMFWNVPAASNGWSEGPSDGSKLPAGSVMGFNIQKKPVYFGPGAPAGPRYHHYVWEVYALNANLDVPPDSTREAVYAAMAGKVVGKAIYVGRYRGEPK
jgi:Raf kinase inhibitor-like YbhB/YbcL family protein